MGSVRFKRSNRDLLKLIFWPEMSQNVLMTLLIVVQFLFVALANSTRSLGKEEMSEGGAVSRDTNFGPVTRFDFIVDEPS